MPLTTSYTIGAGYNGGFEYQINCNGCVSKCWRAGLREEVENYVRMAVFLANDRLHDVRGRYGRGSERNEA